MYKRQNKREIGRTYRLSDMVVKTTKALFPHAIVVQEKKARKAKAKLVRDFLPVPKPEKDSGSAVKNQSECHDSEST